jgi:hypothetical protein
MAPFNATVEGDGSPRSRPRQTWARWRRFLCLLRWHTWEWAYNEDRSDRWRACHYCHRERAVVGFVVTPL